MELTPFTKTNRLKSQNVLELTLANSVVLRHFSGLGTWKNVSSDTDFKKIKKQKNFFLELTPFTKTRQMCVSQMVKGVNEHV